MIEYLKAEIKGIAAVGATITKERRKQKNIFRYMMQKQSFKHKKDEPRPEPKKFKDFDNAQELFDDAWDKYWGLGDKRRNILRRQARVAHLAYGFLRGREYHEIENSTHANLGLFEDQRIADIKERRLFAEVWKMIREFSEEEPQVISQKWAEWCDDAKEYIKEQKAA